MCLASYNCTLYRGHGLLQGQVLPRWLEIRICFIIITSRARIQIFIFSFLSRGNILWIGLTWLDLCGIWISGSVVEFQLCIQWWRSGHTLLMRPDKVETAVHCFCMSCIGVRRIFQLWYYLTHSRRIKGSIPFPRVLVRKWVQ